MNLNTGAIIESLRYDTMQELMVLGNLIDRVNYINTDYAVSDQAERKLLTESLQRTQAELFRPGSRLTNPKYRHFAGQRLLRFSASSKRCVALRSELAGVLDTVLEIRRRINCDDLRIERLQRRCRDIVCDLKYYQLVLKDLLATVVDTNTTSGPDDKHLLTCIQLARHKLDNYQNFPRAYIPEFDEEEYLALNPDVRAAVLNDVFPSGLAHFVAHGLDEVKDEKRNQDENDPIRLMVFPRASLNSDVIAGVESGQLASFVAEETLTTASTAGIGKTLVCDIDDTAIQAAVMSLEQAALDELSLLRSSGIVDAGWYTRNVSKASDSCAHLYLHGFAAGANPNALFDHNWYAKKYLQTDSPALATVLHYLRHGADIGFWPGPEFEVQWYREANHLTLDGYALLAHYLNTGRLEGLNPNSVFDRLYYLRTNPDVAQSDVDAYEHFSGTGWREGRNPSADFEIDFYHLTHFEGELTINPVSHYLQTGRQHRLAINSRHYKQTGGRPALTNVASNLRFFSNQGPDFEEPLTATYTQKPLAKAVAFFLPQFYAFAENDEWWGKGFTEWRNVSRGAPRFEGHYQPRIPRDLGFYNLTDESTLVRQSELALANGIDAFCFYYYWFNGKRLMDKPLDLFAASQQIHQEFCIMWANENWTRTWDGFDSEVLIEQDYREEDEDGFIADTLEYFKNDRYMTVDGRPLFILYRPGLIDSATKTIARWRSKWQATGGLQPLILMVQSFDALDPTVYGLDGAIEFPPHKVCTALPNIHDKLRIIDPAYSGSVVAYNDVVNKSLSEPAPHFPLIKTVSPHWDNDARREGRGMTLHGSTPANYQRWLGGAIKHATKHPFFGEPLVFINAWNEWAESAYLEPDVHYGHAYLNATKRAVHGIANFSKRESILLVGHDAHKHGAQMILLKIAETFKSQFGLRVVIVLKAGGALLDAYKKIGKVYMQDAEDDINLLNVVNEHSCNLAITNTCVAGDLVPELKSMDLKVISLVHELPGLIEEYQLEEHVRHIAEESDHVVFPSEFVERGMLSVVGKINGHSQIIPQGIYKEIHTEKAAGSAVRNSLGIEEQQKMVLNVGYADLRKGFDLFVSTAREYIQTHPEVHFVWLGGMTGELQRWVMADLEGALAERVHIVDFTDNVVDYYHAADCFYLSSREDPYPSVVLEALATGCPAIIYSGATGLDQVIEQHGHIVDRNCSQQTSQALEACLYNDTVEQRTARQRFIKDNYQYDDYCFSLLKLVRPDLRKVSVVVPNYNYARYIEDRLLTVLDQSYPLYEIIVLEDSSTDDSLNVINRVITQSGRKVRLLVNNTNSGNTFRQWQKGLAEARGDLLWIAEADDLASEDFISELVGAFNADTDMGFTDSKMIDSNGKLLGDSYNFYYREIDRYLFQESRSMAGEEFLRRAMTVKNSILNVSSVLWRTQALRSALAVEKEAVLAHQLAGDWRLYIRVLLTQNSKITYLAKSLNTHRRHADSVTHALHAQRHIDEIAEIHEFIEKSIKLTAAQKGEMQDYIKELRIQFKLTDTTTASTPRPDLACSLQRKAG